MTRRSKPSSTPPRCSPLRSRRPTRPRKRPSPPRKTGRDNYRRGPRRTVSKSVAAPTIGIDTSTLVRWYTFEDDFVEGTDGSLLVATTPS